MVFHEAAESGVDDVLEILFEYKGSRLFKTFFFICLIHAVFVKQTLNLYLR